MGLNETGGVRRWGATASGSLELGENFLFILFFLFFIFSSNLVQPVHSVLAF